MKRIVIDTLRKQGKASALALREKAPSMTGTELIAEEDFAPDFDPNKDYSKWKAGAPVRDEGQVWVLLQPHNAAHYSGRPSGNRALWGLAHTTDPKKSKTLCCPLRNKWTLCKGRVHGVDRWLCIPLHCAAAHRIHPGKLSRVLGMG